LTAAAVLGVFSVAACGSTGDGGGADEQMRIGGLGPLSGEAAFLGANTLNYGATLAIDTANDNGGVMGKPVKLITQDDERRTEAAVSGFRNLVAQDVHAGIGPTSATIPGILETMKASGIPWIPIGSTEVLDEGLEDTNVYRNFPSDSLQIPAMMLTAADKGPRIGLVFENNASGQGQHEEAMKYLDGAGDFELVDDLLLAPGQSSYRSEISEFFAKDYDAILWQLTDVTASAFFANAQELGVLDGQYFVGTDAALAEETIGILKPFLGSATFTAVAAAAEGGGLETYTELFHKKFNQDPLVLADTGYDAATVLMLAAEQAQSLDSDAIAQAIPLVAKEGTLCVSFAECAELIRAGEDIDYDGASNSVDFDETHNVASSFTVSLLDANGNATTNATIGEEQIKDLIEAVN
jgi:ABC-type branched-subunit amino acid transport system substrate-binding protein